MRDVTSCDVVNPRRCDWKIVVIMTMMLMTITFRVNVQYSCWTSRPWCRRRVHTWMMYVWPLLLFLLLLSCEAVRRLLRVCYEAACRAGSRCICLSARIVIWLYLLDRCSAVNRRPRPTCCWPDLTTRINGPMRHFYTTTHFTSLTRYTLHDIKPNSRQFCRWLIVTKKLLFVSLGRLKMQDKNSIITDRRCIDNNVVLCFRKPESLLHFNRPKPN